MALARTGLIMLVDTLIVVLIATAVAAVMWLLTHTTPETTPPPTTPKPRETVEGYHQTRAGTPTTHHYPTIRGLTMDPAWRPTPVPHPPTTPAAPAYPVVSWSSDQRLRNFEYRDGWPVVPHPPGPTARYHCPGCHCP